MNFYGLSSKRRRGPGPINLNSVESIDSSGSAWVARFHPDGDYLAAAGNMTNKQLIVYSWNGTDTLAEVETVNTGHNSYDLDWHPTTEHLASVEYSDTTNSVVVYSWNGTDTLASVAVAGVTGGLNGALTCHWHPDGDYLAVGTYDDSSKGLIIYSWNGTDTLAEVESINTGSYGTGVQWSHDGDFLAYTSAAANEELIVYSWNGTDTLTEEDTYDFSGVTVYSPKWSSDDAYIFAGNSGTGYLWAFGFDGSAITLADSIAMPSDGVRGIDIYNDQYIAVGRDRGSAASQVVLGLYSWTVGTETLAFVDDYTTNARGVDICSFNSVGTYIAAPMLQETNVTVRMISMY